MNDRMRKASRGFTERVVVLLLQNFRHTQNQVRQIQAQLILQNLHPNTRIAHLFIRTCESHGLLDSALVLFTTLVPAPHVYIFNNLIRAFSQSQTPHTSLAIYAHMRRNSVHPNNFTFPPLFKSLSDTRHVTHAQRVYAHALKLGHHRDTYVHNSLLHVYAACGHVALCRRLFDEMPRRDVVSWSVLIAGYNNVGSYDDALLVFENMQYAGVVPNRVTMINALDACAHSGNIEMGKWIHGVLKRELDVVLGTALIDMYTKCGRVEEGLGVFWSMKEKNVFTWNAVIKGLALAKSGHEAIWWFNRMERDGVRADEVTLLAVLSACSHAGLVDKGRKIFGLLVDGRYGFCPDVRHYACMVDVLARSGRLREAVEFMGCMPFGPTKSMWGSLLVGSKSQGDLELGLLAAGKLIQMEPENTAYYVHLSNLYAAMGRWSDVEKVRGLMKDRELTKDLGCSSVEVEHQRQACY
ncbi:Pentatricopeptide repeat-containing protein [Spatholobus suberectus]|nr:Pentatricopeptide repeat-containing protein [Spatholobus suberectus]